MDENKAEISANSIATGAPIGAFSCSSSSVASSSADVTSNSSSEGTVAKPEHVYVPADAVACAEGSSSASNTCFYGNSTQQAINPDAEHCFQSSAFGTASVSDTPRNNHLQNFPYFSSSESANSSVFLQESMMPSTCVDNSSMAAQSGISAVVAGSNHDDLSAQLHPLNDSFPHSVSPSQMQNQEYSYAAYSCNVPESISTSQIYGSPSGNAFMSSESAAADTNRAPLINEYNAYGNTASSPNTIQQDNIIQQIPPESQPFYSSPTISACMLQNMTPGAYSESQTMMNNNANSSYNFPPPASPSVHTPSSSSSYQGGNDYLREGYDPQAQGYSTFAGSPSGTSRLMSNRLAQFRNNLQSLSLNKDVLMPRPDGSFFPYWQSLAVNYQGIAESIVDSIFNCEYPPGMVAVMTEQLAYLRRKLQEFPNMAENEKDKFRRLYVLAALGIIAKLKLITFCWTYVELKENERAAEVGGSKTDNLSNEQPNEMMNRMEGEQQGGGMQQLLLNPNEKTDQSFDDTANDQDPIQSSTLI